jgi:hypothetical protein
MHIVFTFYPAFVPENGFRCSAAGGSGKVDAIAYPESASGGTPETLLSKRRIKIG